MMRVAFFLLIICAGISGQETDEVSGIIDDEARSAILDDVNGLDFDSVDGDNSMDIHPILPEVGPSEAAKREKTIHDYMAEHGFSYPSGSQPMMMPEVPTKAPLAALPKEEVPHVGKVPVIKDPFLPSKAKAPKHQVTKVAVQQVVPEHDGLKKMEQADLFLKKMAEPNLEKITKGAKLVQQELMAQQRKAQATVMPKAVRKVVRPKLVQKMVQPKTKAASPVQQKKASSKPVHAKVTKPSVVKAAKVMHQKAVVAMKAQPKVVQQKKPQPQVALQQVKKVEKVKPAPWEAGVVQMKDDDELDDEPHRAAPKSWHPQLVAKPSDGASYAKQSELLHEQDLLMQQKKALEAQSRALVMENQLRLQKIAQKQTKPRVQKQNTATKEKLTKSIDHATSTPAVTSAIVRGIEAASESTESASRDRVHIKALKKGHASAKKVAAKLVAVKRVADTKMVAVKRGADQIYSAAVKTVQHAARKAATEKPTVVKTTKFTAAVPARPVKALAAKPKVQMVSVAKQWLNVPLEKPSPMHFHLKHRQAPSKTSGGHIKVGDDAFARLLSAQKKRLAATSTPFKAWARNDDDGSQAMEKSKEIDQKLSAMDSNMDSNKAKAANKAKDMAAAAIKHAKKTMAAKREAAKREAAIAIWHAGKKMAARKTAEHKAAVTALAKAAIQTMQDPDTTMLQTPVGLSENGAMLLPKVSSAYAAPVKHRAHPVKVAAPFVDVVGQQELEVEQEHVESKETLMRQVIAAKMKELAKIKHEQALLAAKKMRVVKRKEAAPRQSQLVAQSAHRNLHVVSPFQMPRGKLLHAVRTVSASDPAAVSPTSGVQFTATAESLRGLPLPALDDPAAPYMRGVKRVSTRMPDFQQPAYMKGIKRVPVQVPALKPTMEEAAVAVTEETAAARTSIDGASAVQVVPSPAVAAPKDADFSTAAAPNYDDLLLKAVTEPSRMKKSKDWGRQQALLKQRALELMRQELLPSKGRSAAAHKQSAADKNTENKVVAEAVAVGPNTMPDA